MSGWAAVARRACSKCDAVHHQNGFGVTHVKRCQLAVSNIEPQMWHLSRPYLQLGIRGSHCKRLDNRGLACEELPVMPRSARVRKVTVPSTAV